MQKKSVKRKRSVQARRERRKKFKDRKLKKVFKARDYDDHLEDSKHLKSTGGHTIDGTHSEYAVEHSFHDENIEGTAVEHSRIIDDKADKHFKDLLKAVWSIKVCVQDGERDVKLMKRR